MGRRPLCVCLLFFLTVFLTVSRINDDQDKSRQISYDGQPVRLTGIVQEIYEPLERSQDNIILYVKQIEIQTISVNNLSQKWEKQNMEGAVCYLENGQVSPRVGAAVQVTGTAYSFEEAANPGEFDVASYYELRGYQIKVYNTVLEKESAYYDIGSQCMQEMRLKIARIYARILGEKNGALASAMVLGRKKDIDDVTKTLYQSAGISHVLAISGLHISLVGAGTAFLLKRIHLPGWAVCIVASLLIGVYGVFTGMSVSTLRAVIMFLLMMAAQMLGRTSDTVTSLLMAATAILVKEPGYLQDSGFLLSFSAMVGIAAVVPVLKDRGLVRPKPPTMKNRVLDWAYSGFSASLGVALAMMPFLLSAFYTWNPWSLLYNPLAVLLMGILLPWLFFLAGAGILLEKTAALPFLRILALPAGFLFHFLEKTSALMQKLPGSCLHIGMPEIWQIILFGVGLLLLIWFGKKLRPMLRMSLALGLLCIFLIQPPQNLQITMLDVGQGAGFVVQTPSHQTYLLDAGSTSVSGVGKYRIVPYLKYCGVDRLEAVFVSHWDEDHVNGVGDILEWAQQEHIKVGALILPKTEIRDEALEELLALAKSHKIRVIWMNAGDIWEKDGIRFVCLHPHEKSSALNRNAASLVLKMEYGDFGALFPGDLESEQEYWICENYPKELLSADFLAVAHHGSSTSSTERFLDAVEPEAAFISCGEKNRYGHPHKEVLERLMQNGIRWYQTARSGAVTVRVNSLSDMEIQSFF